MNLAKVINCVMVIVMTAFSVTWASPILQALSQIATSDDNSAVEPASTGSRSQRSTTQFNMRSNGYRRRTHNTNRQSGKLNLSYIINVTLILSAKHDYSRCKSVSLGNQINHCFCEKNLCLNINICKYLTFN